jgi:AbrB family looped-hinge helix DNA binding protein
MRSPDGRKARRPPTLAAAIDAAMEQGGTWDELVTRLAPVADQLGLKRYTRSTLRAHARYRLRHDGREVVFDEVQVKMAPKPQDREPDQDSSSIHGEVRLNEQGRIVIPAECRAAAGLKPGDELLVEVIGKGELRLRTPEQALREAQQIVALYGSGRDLVAELIAERREEATHE